MKKIQGIVKTIRKFKWGNIFIIDCNNLLYQIIDNNKTDININDFLYIEGKLDIPTSPIKNEKLQKEELIAEKIDILIKGQQFDENTQIFRLNNIKDVLLWRSETINKFNEFFRSYINIQTPKLLNTTSEGGAAVFKTEEYTLSQSPQLYKQMACINLNMPVKEIAVCFRNEPFNSSKHIPEFISLDCELPISLPVVEHVYKPALEFLMNLFNIEKFTIISLQSDLIKTILNRKEVKDLNREDELNLFKYFNTDLIVTTHYDNDERAFYTYKDQSFDILYKGVEVCSGSVRIFYHEEYLKSFKERKLEPNNFKDYLDTFKTKSIYTGGFAIGLDRLAALHFNITNIKEAKI